MNDRQFAALVDSIRQTDPAKREQWANAQPPLIDALDPADADDGPEPEILVGTPQNRR